ncbi:MAG: CBS domain-containing protein [Candidatus Hodarchaeales archaeon]
MLVEDLMRRSVETVYPITGVLEVTTLMNSKRISSVIVVEKSSGKPVGIITKRDLLKKCLERCINPCELIAKDVYTTPLVSISPGETVTKALSLILERDISTLPVLNQSRDLIGVITANDIITGLESKEIPGKKTQPGTLEVERH